MAVFKKKVLIVASTFPRWQNDKIPDFIYQLATSLIKEDFEVHVLAPHFKGAKIYEIMNGVYVHRFFYFIPKFETLTYGGGSVNNINKNFLTNFLIPFYLLFNFLWMFYLNLKYKFEIVNVHWILPSGFIAVIQKPIFKFKLILSSHGGDILGLTKNKLWTKLGLKKFISFTLSFADEIIAVNSFLNQKIKNYIPNTDENKFHIISVGIKFSNFNLKDREVKNFNKEGVNLLFVGRLAKEKAVRYLIHAIDWLKREGFNVYCTIAGDGSERESLMALTKDLGLNYNINFLGFVNNSEIPNLLYKNDIFISTSLREGLPTTYLEAMATGIPIVVSRTEGIEDLVKNTKNGILYDIGNVSALKESIKLLINNQDLYLKISKNAVTTAKFYDWSVISKKYREVHNKD